MISINSKTHLYAVLGDPVEHSLSPVMHNRAFSHTLYNAVYLAFQVKDIAGAVSGIRALNICGASITIPHKISVMQYLDFIEQTAAKIGAVNTVVNREGSLHGYNTDAWGAVKALKDYTDETSLAGASVDIVGAGGAARAIGFGLAAEDARIKILNRTRENGEALARVLAADYHPLTPDLRLNSDILVNTTPVGMTPSIGASPIPPTALKPGMVVMDIVYNPINTRLLRDARQMGCLTIDGTAMFVNQGAFQFELWTGRTAPAGVMQDAVLEALNNSESKH
jgi:shikimate dehydrogenase